MTTETDQPDPIEGFRERPSLGDNGLEPSRKERPKKWIPMTKEIGDWLLRNFYAVQTTGYSFVSWEADFPEALGLTIADYPKVQLTDQTEIIWLSDDGDGAYDLYFTSADFHTGRYNDRAGQVECLGIDGEPHILSFRHMMPMSFSEKRRNQIKAKHRSNAS